MRGVVEGFYGPPWSHDERLSMLRFLAEQGLDSYVYAPKNDVHHRRRWRAPYPAEQLARFGELFAAGERLGVPVTFGVAPARLLGHDNITRLGDRDGDGIGDAGWEALTAKLASLQAVGARRFMLLFDDTATTLLPAIGGRGLGRFHARVGLRTVEFLRRTDPTAELLLVPAAYSGTWDRLGAGGRAYWAGLGELGDAATVAWTGPDIFSQRIAAEDAATLARETGLRLVVWNNAVANDWVHMATGDLVGLRGWRKLSFGPVANLDPALGAATAGVLLNGALEPRLTRVPLAALAAWSRDPATYDPVQVHRDALDHAGPAEPLAELHELVARHLWVAPDRREASALMAALDGGVRGELRDRLTAIADLGDALSDATPALQAEVQPTLHKANLLARATLDQLDGRARSARALRREARAIRWLVARRPFARLAREL